MEERSFKIYSLSDPNDINNIRYIGMTGVSLKSRLCRHLSRSKCGSEVNHRVCWINYLVKNGYKPHISLIEDNLTESEAKTKEINYIKLYRDNGFDLVNTSNGGEYNQTSEQVKNKLSQTLQKFDITKEELYDLYVVQNKKCSEVAKYYGCSECLIDKKCKKYNITKKPPKIQLDLNKLHQLYIIENKTLIEL